jgi:hypothetical protein
MSVYTATPYSRSKIRRLTNLIRSIFGLDDIRYFPIVHMLEIGLPKIYVFTDVQQQKINNK